MKILISDFHAGCQMWQAALLKELGHDVFIESCSGHSRYIDQKFIKKLQTDVIKKVNIHNISSNILTEQDINYLENNFDTVIASFPPKFIDVFKNVKFKHPKILNCGHRLHIHTRNDPFFLKNLKKSVEDGEIILCSMSKYDTEYIKHYLDIIPIELKVVCFHVPYMHAYNPSRNEILVGPCHAHKLYPFDSISEMNYASLNLGYPLFFSKIKDIYQNYKYEDLLNHKAVVIFPYSIFSISIAELYELNIPMFVPSKELLLNSGLLNDVSLYPCYCPQEEMLAVDIPSKNSPHKFSPNSYLKHDKNYWLDFSYFFDKQNIIFWNSPSDLFEKLVTLDLNSISQNMRLENEYNRSKELDNWKNVLINTNSI